MNTRARFLWLLPVLLALAGCSREETPKDAPPVDAGAPASPAVQPPAAPGDGGAVDAALEARIDSLVAKLETYRANLPPLEAFGYRPAADGIRTGMVIVCGHVMPPPYQVEADIENRLVRLNGIELRLDERFNVAVKCLGKINAIRAARERAEHEARMRELAARPGVAEKCAKKQEIREHGVEFFRRRVQELGIVKDEKTGQPNDWDKVFQACRDTKAELERVYGDVLKKVLLPESKLDTLIFAMKEEVYCSRINETQIVSLRNRYPDKQRWRDIYIHDEKEIQEYQKRRKQREENLIRSLFEEFRSTLDANQVILVGADNLRVYGGDRAVDAIHGVFSRDCDPRAQLSELIGSWVVPNSKHPLREENEILLLIVLAAQEHSRRGR